MIISKDRRLFLITGDRRSFLALGAHGLYGMNVGSYAKVLQAQYKNNLSRHFVISGLSGVMQGTEERYAEQGVVGLPSELPHLGLVMPTKSVLYNGQHIPIKTSIDLAKELLEKKELDPTAESKLIAQLAKTLEAAKEAGVVFYDRQVSIWAGPGGETDKKVDDFMNEYVSGIDVESGPLALAAYQLMQETGVLYTVNCVFINSDDPKAAFTDPSQAFGATADSAEKRKTPESHLVFYRELNNLNEVLDEILK